MTDPGPFVTLGRVVKPHGLGGELSVRLEPGIPGIPVGIEVAFVPPPSGLRRAPVTGVRQGPKGPLVSFAGVDSIDDAETLRGLSVSAHVDDLPGDWEVCATDPVGLRVLDEERGDIGIVAEVIHTGANDVWVVRGGPFGEVLVPVIDDVVTSSDPDAGVCSVRLLPGLIEEDA